MYRKSLCVVLCVLMMVTLFPVAVMASEADEAYQNLPINEGMESQERVNAIRSTVQSGTVALTQDRVSGKYAVKVTAQDEPGTYVSYTLANSVTFKVYEYSQIKLWVKPGSGAQWIKFFTGSNVLIKNDINSDGTFKIGEDLVSGKWNEVTLDLNRTSPSNLTETSNLSVQTNEYSTWTYDEITSIYAPVTKIDPVQLANGQTYILNGGVEFKRNLTSTYNTTPTVLTSQSKPTFTKTDTSQSDFQSGTLTNAKASSAGDLTLAAASTTVTPYNVRWIDASPAAIVTNNTIEKSSSGPFSWDTGAISEQTIEYGDGYLEFKAPYTDKYVMCGLTADNSDYSYSTIDYAIYMVNGGSIYIYENGASLGSVSTYAVNDILKVAVESGIVKYYKNGSLIYTSTVAPKYPLFADCSIYSPGGKILEAKIAHTPYSTSGNIISPVMNISSQTNVGNSSVLWTPSLPTNTALSVETNLSLDGGVTWQGWQAVTNGGTIPGLTSGSVLSNARLKYKATLSTTDSGVTPKLYEITTGIFSKEPSVLPGKISRISIDSSYVTTSGPISSLPAQRLYLPGVLPAKYTMSGNGNRIIYADPGDGNKLHLLDLNNGENRKISDYVPSDFKTNFDGTKVAFKVTGTTDQTIREDDLYLYNDVNKTTTFISHWIQDFDMQKDGSVSYIYTYIYWDASIGSHHYQYRINYYSLTPTPSDTTCLSGDKLYTSPPPGFLHVSVRNNQIYYNDYTKLNVLSMTPAGWKSSLLTTTSMNIDGIWTNSDGTLVFLKTTDGFFSYQVSSKALRKLDLRANTIVRVTDDNKLVVQGTNAESQIYNLDTDLSKNIRPTDAVNWNFDTDDSGNKMAYTSPSGLSISYPNGVQRPERYLFSFDGKSSWLSYKNGAWTVVKTGAAPVKEDFDKYGMTIDEVNALNEGDFANLYADGRQIYNFDAAVYFASVDPFTTPSLKGIKVILNGGENEFGTAPLEKSLYTTKQQNLDSTKWRKIRKIYPIEIQPKEAEMYYFIVKDAVYKSYKNNQWTAFDGQLLANAETNWITITQQGMTAEELRAIPEASLQSLLPTGNLSVVYAMKVDDVSTAGYSSLITVDYVEKLFDTPHTLKIKYVDGTTDEYPGMSQDGIENFMEWMNERQFNRGAIFYPIKTVINGVEVNDFINYYTIKSVSVNDSLPS